MSEYMKNIKNQKTSITVITGFLGSGKTTFLSKYIKYLQKNNENPAVIVNEYGNLDIDSHAISNDIEVVSILNGCVCCDLQLDLIKQLKHFLSKSATRHIIIEATGLAHPIDIIAACQDPEIVEQVSPPTVIGLVDGPRFLNRGQYTKHTIQLMEEQLAVCHAIVMNKMDLIDHNKQVMDMAVNEINPTASKYFTTYANLSMDNIHITSDNSGVKASTHAHHHGINSVNYHFSGPINRQLFYQFILLLPDNFLRLKGYVKFRDMPNDIYEFQYAFGLPDYQIVDEALPLTLVIIGEQLDENKLRNQLDMLQFT